MGPEGERELDKFFKYMFVGPEEMGYEGHPPAQMLEEYVRTGNLEDRWRFADGQFIEDFMKGRMEDWNLCEVSLHVATCRWCKARVAEMRAAELARPERNPLWKRLRESKERIVAWDIDGKMAYYFPIAYVTMGLLVLLLNALLNITSPSDYTSPDPLLQFGGGDGPIPY